MIEFNAFITQSLSPALAISASGMLSLGMHNRLSVLGGRVRQLNRELAQTDDPARITNFKKQIGLFSQRAQLIRNALFLLYAAICLMVLTAFALAMTDLSVLHDDWPVPIVTFLSGLGLIFWAVILEAREVLLILKALDLDIAGFAESEPNSDIKTI